MTDDAHKPQHKLSWLQSFKVYLEAPTLRMLALGFSAGLPLMLVLGTLSFWLREAGIELVERRLLFGVFLPRQHLALLDRLTLAAAKIDDPLPRNPQIDPQRRLHDTINSLNRNQRHQLLHFGADGLGRGVRWELITKQPL